ncbi:hypothetical protein ACIQUB_06085 [Rhizobium sp. NPDC090275]|uniref:hypothetical protein n=1 Tax=Rhizobium sp. NPDC090275 TaxID=3364498 RepID=UPI003839F394
MKRWINAFAIGAVILCADTASADEAWDRVMVKMADVIAIQKLCPTLRPVTKVMMVAIAAFDIDLAEGTADNRKLMDLTRYKISLLNANGGRDMACATGIALYGPQGLNGANMMEPY